jgi:penicillin-binding protein 1C
VERLRNECRKKIWLLGLCALALGLWLLGYVRAEPILSRFSYSRQIVDRNGELLRITLSGDEKYRVLTPLSEFSDSYIALVIAREDRFFKYHFGINPAALIKAMVATYTGQGRRFGASTVTMQLARRLSTRGSKTIFGKMTQICDALALELFHSKSEILEAYLNLLPFGGNIEGAGAASLVYFKKPAKSIGLNQAVALTLIPQNPNAHSLRFKNDITNDRLNGQSNGSASRLSQSKLHLEELWLERHPEDRDVFKNSEKNLDFRPTVDLPFLAPHFVNLYLERNPSLKMQSKVTTTLDISLQNTIEGKISKYIESKRSVGVVNAAAMIVDHTNMQVLASVGSANFFDDTIDGQFNGTLGRRSPGSAIKPMIYALALDQGLIHPETLLRDTPMSFGGFDPENFDRHFAGPLSASDALTRSRNVPAVYLASLIKSPTVYDMLKLGGVRSLRDSNFYGLSVALGGAEVTMEEIVKLYGALANRGNLQELRYSISDRSAKEISISNQSHAIKLFSPEAAFLTLDMLRSNLRDDDRNLAQWLRETPFIAWKTGTSHGFRDAWTIGLVGKYIIAVWLGNFGGESNPQLVGRETAAPLFFSIADGFRQQSLQTPDWALQNGLGLKKTKVCALSGHLPGPHCQHLKETWFIPEKSPISKCDIHREIVIEPRLGLRACDENRPGLKHEIFEFWPSDLLNIFKAAGIPRRTPPAFEPGCNEKSGAANGAPKIVSPRSKVTYSYRVNDREHALEDISLAAVSEADAQRLHWFIGNKYLGDTSPLKPMSWSPKPGHYLVKVVDDLGRSDERSVEVKVSR